MSQYLFGSHQKKKNAEWINYIYYNQQRFINYTDDALTLLGDQVHATSRMTWQNRQALNWLLADNVRRSMLYFYTK